jgi:hypothetical protein
MPSARQRASRFLVAERDRLGWRVGDLPMLRLSQVVETLHRLELILADYEAARVAFWANLKNRRPMIEEGGEGSRPLTPAEVDLLRQAREVNALLHLRIETFYVFAKILLDQIALTVRDFFGPAVGLKLSKHSELRRNLAAYAEQKGLRAVPASLGLLIEQVSGDIADFRDRYVAHDANPRRFRGTMFTRATGETALHVSSMLPKEGEEGGVISLTPPKLIETLDAYVDAVISYFETQP